jgi:hypothetical protein
MASGSIAAELIQIIDALQIEIVRQNLVIWHGSAQGPEARAAKASPRGQTALAGRGVQGSLLAKKKTKKALIPQARAFSTFSA